MGYLPSYSSPARKSVIEDFVALSLDILVGYIDAKCRGNRAKSVFSDLIITNVHVSLYSPCSNGVPVVQRVLPTPTQVVISPSLQCEARYFLDNTEASVRLDEATDAASWVEPMSSALVKIRVKGVRIYNLHEKEDTTGSGVGGLGVESYTHV